MNQIVNRSTYHTNDSKHLVEFKDDPGYQYGKDEGQYLAERATPEDGLSTLCSLRLFHAHRYVSNHALRVW